MTWTVCPRGISKRWFLQSFTIADDVEVKGAELKDGLLKISVERIIQVKKQELLKLSNFNIGRVATPYHLNKKV